jgi:hypothetical protein
MECDPWPSLRSVAKSVPAMENRNLLRCEDATNWTFGVLGVHLAGAQESVAFLEVDGGNGALRASEAEEFVSSTDRW